MRRRVFEESKLVEAGGNSSREKDGAISWSTGVMRNSGCDEVIHTQYDTMMNMKHEER
jgi:isoaspartyl peptidase/L-asparaginase-like protein (Ntn-hydrolase superfamily)